MNTSTTTVPNTRGVAAAVAVAGLGTFALASVVAGLL
jgi:hypothetical protein